MHTPFALAAWQAVLLALAGVAALWTLFVAALYAGGRGPAARALARLIPDLLVLFKRLLTDPRVPRRAKLALGLGLGYLALPFDLVPDFIPLVGQLDDAVIVGLVLRFALSSSGEDLVVEHWPGPPESLAGLLRLMRSPERPRSLAWLWTLVCLILVPVALFLALAEDVWEHEVISWDTSILNFARHHREHILNDVVRVFTQLGSGPVVLVALAVVAVLLWRRERRRDAWFAVIGGTGAMLLDLALKNIFDRPRPDLVSRLVTTHDYSFPSGHTMSSMGFAAVLIVLTRAHRRRWWIAAAALVYAAAIGVSRVYLGVHYPSDVVAGWTAAVAWVAAVRLLLDAWWRRRERLGEQQGGAEGAATSAEPRP